MIDTIVLLLDKDAFQITDPNKFDPHARLILEKKIIVSKQNPLKKMNDYE